MTVRTLIGLLASAVLLAAPAAAQQATPLYQWEQTSADAPITLSVAPDSARASTGQRFAFAWLGLLAGAGVGLAVDQPAAAIVGIPAGAMLGVGLANRAVYDRWHLKPAAVGALLGSAPILLAVSLCRGDADEMCGMIAIPAFFTVPLGASVTYLLFE